MSFSKVDFSGLPKSSSTVRRGRDQAGGRPRPADGGPFLFEGPVATEPKVRFSRTPRLGGFLRPASQRRPDCLGQVSATRKDRSPPNSAVVVCARSDQKHRNKEDGCVVALVT